MCASSLRLTFNLNVKGVSPKSGKGLQLGFYSFIGTLLNQSNAVC